MRRLPKELTTVTRLSKFIALIMFITLPILAFAFGMNYKEIMEQNKKFMEAKTTVSADEYPCELDVTVCPDNSLVGRYPPSCNYATCGVEEPSSGNVQVSPTATATPEESKTSFECPKGKWVDCMPGPGKGKKKECGSEYLDWAQANCPGFQGAAL